jgi:polyhydroxyalkanoate depolymerase
MPASVMTLFPFMLNGMEAMKIPLELVADFALKDFKGASAGLDILKNTHDAQIEVSRNFLPLMAPFCKKESCEELLDLYRERSDAFFGFYRKNLLRPLLRFYEEREGELEFLNLFTEELPPQDWSVEYDCSNILLDLPGLRCIDISANLRHSIDNYTVVFAPRAGHHSNIAERVALYLRSQGLTRMAIVEQKCAEDIPLYVGGRRHHENFEGQIRQYTEVLEHLKRKTGFSPHLVAVCQPGPLLMTTLILRPDLGKTFGSAGAPMHTEAERGFLTDFARSVGKNYIERLNALFGQTVCDDRPGSGREIFDGRLHVLGFYLLSMDQHVKNFRQLLDDLKSGKSDSAERQKAFYEWYNYVQSFPRSFIEDTYKKIFVGNELIRGDLVIDGKTIGIVDYPGSVPLWALGGKNDNIAPPLQATGHMELIESVPEEDKLTLVCNGGHMALFRSQTVLDEYYTKIAQFMLDRSDLELL